MTHWTEKHNQNNLHKPIQADYLFDFNIATVGGRLRVPHTHFAAIFDLSPASVEGVLSEWALQTGQRDTVWQRGCDEADGVLWADSCAVLVLVDHFRCQPSVAERLLGDLGFYQVQEVAV